MKAKCDFLEVEMSVVNEHLEESKQKEVEMMENISTL
jgi:hypothetical protein